MELILERIAKRKTYTIGRLYIAQEINDSDKEGHPGLRQPLTEGLQICDTLEPTWRDYKHGAYKVKGRSAIPEGRYAVVITYSPKFKQWLPILLGDAEFNRKWQGIRIHAGNTVKDTEGCILAGKNKLVGQLVDSRTCVRSLKQKIVEAKDNGEAVWLTVR